MNPDCLSVCLSACIHGYMDPLIHGCMCACMHAHTHTHVQIWINTCIYIYVYIHAHVHTCIGMLIYIYNLYSLLFIYVFSYLYNIKYQSHKRSYLQQRGRCLLYLRSCSQHKIASFTRHSSACWLGSIFIRTEDFCSILILAGSLSRLQLQNQEA